MVAVQRIFKEPEVVWRTANPLWHRYLSSGDTTLRANMGKPFLMRFASDRFIEDFMALVQRSPSRIREWEAARETWRLPLPPQSPTEAVANWSPPDTPAELAGEILKLYQPVHKRFYLVTASLVCRIPGLPDKMLDLSADERATFVLRREIRTGPNKTLTEHAFINGTWHPVANGEAQQLQRNADDIPEEQYPLFPAHYTDPLTGVPRRLFAGLVPVSQREMFFTAGKHNPNTLTAATGSGAAAASADQPLTLIDQFMTVFNMDVLTPWRQHLREVDINRNDGKGYTFAKISNVYGELGGHSSGEIIKALSELKSSVEDTRDQLQTAAWYTLLDFAYFLEKYLPDVMGKITNASNPLSGAQLLLYNLLSGRFFQAGSGFVIDDDPLTGSSNFYDLVEGESGGGISMAEAIRLAYQNRVKLEKADESGLASSRFLLTGINVRTLANGTGVTASSTDDSLIGVYLRDALQQVYGTAQTTDKRIPELPEAVKISATLQDGDYSDNVFYIRCVFERPHCPPGVRPEVVSQRSEAFTMASFFDPDAPARPIRIPMPVDTTPSGLRKFAKNTMFVLSDTLACQLEAARKITFGDLVLSVLPWPFHKPLPDIGAGNCKPGLSIGMLCTLSIPIITIVALILLIIMVLLLNIIFNWIPFLIFCLPLPGLKAKDS